MHRRRRYSTNLLVDGAHVHVLGNAPLTERDCQAIAEMARCLKKHADDQARDVFKTLGYAPPPR